MPSDSAILAALARDGWEVETTPGPTGRPYHRARRDGWQRGSYRPASLAELCAETPAGTPRGTPVQLRLWRDAA